MRAASIEWASLALPCGEPSNPAMQSDAKVPDPAPRGITVPAVAVVVLVLTGAIWGVGLFLLGRQTAPPVEVLDSNGAAQLAALNRIDQAIVRGDTADALGQLRTVILPEGPIGQTALALRQARLTALAAERAAQAEAASPAAVLRRLRTRLWSSVELAPPAVAVPPSAEQNPPDPAVVVPAPAPAAVPTPFSSPLAEEKLGDQPFVPLARILHPTVTGRAYALHPTRGLLRSDDGGKQWRVGLEPLRTLTGTRLAFTQGDAPLLLIIGTPGWIFADDEAAFYP